MRAALWIAVIAIVLLVGALTYGRALLRPMEPASVRELTVEGFEYGFDPGEITLSRGDTVRVVFRNTGTIEHDFTIPDLDVATPVVNPGEEATVEFMVRERGTFRYLCTVPGHNELGMNGTLRVP